MVDQFGRIKKEARWLLDLSPCRWGETAVDEELGIYSL